MQLQWAALSQIDRLLTIRRGKQLVKAFKQLGAQGQVYAESAVERYLRNTSSKGGQAADSGTMSRWQFYSAK